MPGLESSIRTDRLAEIGGGARTLSPVMGDGGVAGSKGPPRQSKLFSSEFVPGYEWVHETFLLVCSSVPAFTIDRVISSGLRPSVREIKMALHYNS